MSYMRHIFREANRYANGLAKRGRTQPVDFVVFNETPYPEFVSFVNLDSNSLYLRRSANTLPLMPS